MAAFYLDGEEISRQEAVDILLKEWGNRCMYPGCTDPFDDNKHCITIDHHYPQSKAVEDGWELESIHGIDNLRLLGKRCNSKKGNFIFDENGNLPVVEKVRKVKSIRPNICNACNNGRKIFPGDECGVCGTGPRPKTAPGVFQRPPAKCSHTAPEHCKMCWIGHVKRIELVLEDS